MASSYMTTCCLLPRWVFALRCHIVIGVVAKHDFPAANQVFALLFVMKRMKFRSCTFGMTLQTEFGPLCSNFYAASARVKFGGFCRLCFDYFGFSLILKGFSIAVNWTVPSYQGFWIPMMFPSPRPRHLFGIQT